MKIKTVLLILAFTAVATLKAQNADKILLKDFRPVSIYKIPVSHIERAAYPIIDAHTHDYAKNDAEIKEWIKAMDACGIEKSVVLTETSGPKFDTICRLYSKYNKKISQEILETVQTIDNPSKLADTVAAYMPLNLEVKQRLLETLDTTKRLELIYGHISSEIEIIKTEERIKGRVKKQMEKTQREYYLNEQMRAIQKEMGEKDDFKSELEELEKRIKRKRMSTEATAKIKGEFKKLKLMSPMSAEATVVRNYIDWLLSLPWFEKTKDKIDIDKAKIILDEDHFGLEKPKERILEYLAVQALVKKIRGPILCLVGPPGVGKTSLARSVARSMNRNFIRVSLGGVRDEAEIRGHRRTYIGAMPGKIIQSLRKVKSNNPVFCLDEVDKMSMDFRGDPSAALLEVLDPEQNYAFSDHYLDVDYDLSEIFFITTANTLHAIPMPLQDRMEIIHLAGYSELDKLSIAQGFLVSKQCKTFLSTDVDLIYDDVASAIVSYHDCAYGRSISCNPDVLISHG